MDERTAKTGSKATKKKAAKKTKASKKKASSSKTAEKEPERAEREPERAGPRKPGQSSLLEPTKKNADVERLSKRLDDERWNRMEWGKREKKTADLLLAKLHELGLDSYERDGIHVEVVKPTEEKVRVKVDPAARSEKA